MTAQKIVLILTGKTVLIPPSALFSFDSAIMQIYAANFSERIALNEIQEITLLDFDHATPTEMKLLEYLSGVSVSGTEIQKDGPGRGRHPLPQNLVKSKDLKKKRKKETKLVSGMI